MSAPGNTFEAPPQTSRVPDLPPPFAPMLPQPKLIKQHDVATMPPGVQLTTTAATAGAPSAQKPAPTMAPSTLYAAVPGAPKVTSKVTSKGGRKASGRPGGKKKGASTGVAHRLLGMLILMGLVMGGLFTYRQYRAAETSHPDAWDPRVLEIVDFVETTRGLTFEHPVYVDFLDDATFMTTFAESEDAPLNAPAAQRAYENELLDALGLTNGADVAGAQTTMAAATALSTYTPATDRVAVRGTELSPAVRAALTHQLTHALQAQHFDLRGKTDEAGMKATAEADAMRVEAAFRASLAPEEQTAAQQTPAPAADAASLSAVPWTLVELQYVPYVLGPRLVDDVFTAKGNAGVDELMAQPPTDRQLISPWSWRPGAEPTAAMSTHADAPEGSSIIESNQPLSVVQMLVSMDAWLTWTMARSALDNWVGGTYTSYRSGPSGPLCVAIAAAFDGPADRFADAVIWWTTAMGSPSTPIVNGQYVTFSLCARGASGALPPQPAVSTTTAILVEATSVAPAGDTPSEVQTLLCAARTVIDDPALAPAFRAGPSVIEKDANVSRRFMTAAAACGA
jgi:hypothetical protein